MFDGQDGILRGFTPCRHLRPSLGRKHTFKELIQSGDDDYMMNDTIGRNLPLGHDDVLLFSISGTGSFISGRTDTAGHTETFDYPVPQTYQGLW